MLCVSFSGSALMHLVYTIFPISARIRCGMWDLCESMIVFLKNLTQGHLRPYRKILALSAKRANAISRIISIKRGVGQLRAELRKVGLSKKNILR